MKRTENIKIIYEKSITPINYLNKTVLYHNKFKVYVIIHKEKKLTLSNYTSDTNILENVILLSQSTKYIMAE